MEPIVEILAKTARFHLHQRIPVGGADKAHIHRLELAAADSLHCAGLDKAQQLALQIQVHLADLVEKQGTAIGQTGCPFAIPLGASKRALHMTEDLALHQIMGNGGAVEGNKGLFAAGTALVNRLGTHLFAGAALASDKDGRLAGRRTFDDAIDRLHRHGGTDKTEEGAALEILPIVGNQRAQLLVFQGIANGGAEPLAVKRLGQKIEGTEAHRLHRHIHRAVGGDHYHRAGQLLFGDHLQNIHTGHIRQLQIQQHHGGRTCQQLRQRLLTTVGQHHLIPLLAQVLFIDHRQTTCIFHQQDTRFIFSHWTHPCI